MPCPSSAAPLDPDMPRYGYVYALALEWIGNKRGALQVLEGVHRQHCNDPEVLHALATAHLQRCERTEALKYAEALVTLSPEDPAVLHLLQTIQQAPDQVGP
jgi:Flp pilus assembly protein TadD